MPKAPYSEGPHDGPGDERSLAALLAAGAEPTRLRLLALLREPKSVHDLCDAVGMSQPRVSHHLAILREQGLVTLDRDGRRHIYRWSSPSPEGATGQLMDLLGRWLGLPTGTNSPPEFKPKRERKRAPKGPATESTSAPTNPPPAPAPMEDYLL